MFFVETCKDQRLDEDDDDDDGGKIDITMDLPNFSSSIRGQCSSRHKKKKFYFYR